MQKEGSVLAIACRRLHGGLHNPRIPAISLLPTPKLLHAPLRLVSAGEGNDVSSDEDIFRPNWTADDGACLLDDFLSTHSLHSLIVLAAGKQFPRIISVSLLSQTDWLADPSTRSMTR